MMRKLVSLLLTLTFLAACAGTLEFGIERAPLPAAPPLETPAAPTGDAAGRLLPTLEALRVENERLRATVEANPPTATPEPPDLGRVAYVYGGDIWVKDLAGGRSFRVTSDGRDSEPVWSPSGHWLAFRKERTVVVQEECELPKPQHQLCRESVWQRQVWLAQPEQGIIRQLNDGFTIQSFAWSPARDRLAFVDGSGNLSVVEVDRMQPDRLIAAGEFATAGAIAWSPDGAWIAFEFSRNRPGAAEPEHGLWKISPDGGDPLPVLASERPGESRPRLAGWSSRGDTLLFWQDPDGPALDAGGTPLFGVAAAGSGSPAAAAARLAFGTTLLYPDFVAPAPAEADGAGRVAVVLGAGQATWQDKRLALLAAGQPAGPGAGPGEPSQLSAEAEAAISPAWSPSGAWLAYSAMPVRAGLELGDTALPELMLRRIWVVEAATGVRQQLTGSSEYRDEFPRWSRDGRHLLFARLDATGQASLWVVPAAGGEPFRAVDEITPAPDPLGAFGHIAWPQFFDWTRGSTE